MILALPILALAAALPQDLTPAEEASPCNHGQRYYYDVRFEPGQRWSYHSRPGDVGSVLTIGEIDNMPEVGEVVHIVVDHIGSQNSPRSPIGNGRSVYFAIKRDSLDASVVALIDVVQIPYINPAAYLRWHLNCTGLTYATTVADTLTTLDLLRCEQETKATGRRSPQCQTAAGPSTPRPSTSAPSPTGPAEPSAAPADNSPPPASSPPSNP